MTATLNLRLPEDVIIGDPVDPLGGYKPHKVQRLPEAAPVIDCPTLADPHLCDWLILQHRADGLGLLKSSYCEEVSPEVTRLKRFNVERPLRLDAECSECWSGSVFVLIDRKGAPISPTWCDVCEGKLQDSVRQHDEQLLELASQWRQWDEDVDESGGLTHEQILRSLFSWLARQPCHIAKLEELAQVRADEHCRDMAVSMHM